MKTPIEVLKQRENEIFSCMEGIDGEEWDYCTKALAETREAILQLERDQLKIENLKSFINKQIESNNALAGWEPMFSSVKYNESTKVLKQCLSAL